MVRPKDNESPLAYVNGGIPRCGHKYGALCGS